MNIRTVENLKKILLYIYGNIVVNKIIPNLKSINYSVCKQHGKLGPSKVA